MKNCSECNGKLIENLQNGEVTCTECGLINDERLIFDTRMSPKLIDPDNNYLKTFGPCTDPFFPIAYSTFVKPSEFRNLPNTDQKRIFNRMNKIETRTKRIGEIMLHFERLAKQYAIPTVIVKESQAELVKLIMTKTFRRFHRSFLGYFVASIYYFGQQRKVIFSLKKLSALYNVNEKYVNFSLKNLKIPKNTSSNMGNVLSREYNKTRFNKKYDQNQMKKEIYARFSSQIIVCCESNKINLTISNSALKILQQYMSHYSVDGKDPSGIIGACILVAAKKHNMFIKQTTLANIVKITPVTLRARITEIEKKKLIQKI